MPEDYHCVWKLGHLVSTSEILSLQNPSCPKACVWSCLAPWSTAAGISPGSSLVPSTLSPLHLFLLCCACFCHQALLLTQVCLKRVLLLPQPPYSWDCRCVLPCPDNRIFFQMTVLVKAAHKCVCSSCSVPYWWLGDSQTLKHMPPFAAVCFVLRQGPHYPG